MFYYIQWVITITYNECLIMVLELFDASSRSVSSHSFTQGPLVYSRLRIIDILLKEGRRTVIKDVNTFLGSI